MGEWIIIHKIMFNTAVDIFQRSMFDDPLVDVVNKEPVEPWKIDVLLAGVPDTFVARFSLNAYLVRNRVPKNHNVTLHFSDHPHKIFKPLFEFTSRKHLDFAYVVLNPMATLTENRKLKTFVRRNGTQYVNLVYRAIFGTPAKK